MLIIIAIAVGFLTFLIGTVILLSKSEKSNKNNQAIISFAVVFIILMLSYDSFRNTTYAYVIMLSLFTLSIGYGIYVFLKLKKSAS